MTTKVLEIQNRGFSHALMNYSTCLLEYDAHNKLLYKNNTRYSQATSKIQELINNYLKNVNMEISEVIELENITEGTKYLSLNW